MLTANNNNILFKSTQQQNTLPSPPIHQHTTMTRDQQKYCGAIMRNLKKHRDAAPFLNPVDYVKLNVPDYPTIVKQPMDLMMVDRKLNASEYATVDDFVADVRLIFNNCFKYNGPEAMISVLCQNVESAFEKSLRQMPVSQPLVKESSPQTNLKKELSPPLSQHNSPPQHVPEYKLLSEDLARPKREIHCPSKDYPETYTTQRKLGYNKSNAIKFCLQTLKELKKAKYRDLVYPFLQPVDPVALSLPDYTSIVKHPMDLQTIEDKLMNDEYKRADEFEADVTLMFDNCYLYNPPSLPIYGMAKDLEKVFKDKWAQRPEEKKVESDVDDYDSEVEVQKRKPRRASTKQKVAEDEDERDDRIAELERHIANISEQIKSIKSQKKATPPPPKTVRRGRGPNKKPPVKRKTVAYSSGESSGEEEEGLTFDQKKDLSEMINNLTGDSLNTVVSIIQNSMPNLNGNGQEEIVLDIDSLDIKTLRKLSEFVNLPIKKNPSSVKRSRTHYSARDADKKIQELENTLKKFNRQVDSSSSDSGEDDEDEGSSSGSSSSESD